jgi:hypothetical protein
MAACYCSFIVLHLINSIGFNQVQAIHFLKDDKKAIQCKRRQSMYARLVFHGAVRQGKVLLELC